MPRYSFYVHDSKEMPDKMGTEFPDDVAAKAQAVVFTGELLTDLDGGFWGHTSKLEVLDDIGSPVCEISVTARSGD